MNCIKCLLTQVMGCLQSIGHFHTLHIEIGKALLSDTKTLNSLNQEGIYWQSQQADCMSLLE